MTYYAADNHYGDEKSQGFQNTWYVIQFENKKERDRFVEKSDKLSTRAIKASEIKKWGDVKFEYKSGELESVAPCYN